MTSSACQINVNEAADIVQWVFSPERCLPLVMVSRNRSGEMAVEASVLQRDMIGLAKVISCDDSVAWAIGKELWPLLCYDGAVRIYAPGFHSDDNEFKHRSWKFHEIKDSDYGEFLELLRDECARRIYYPEGRDALRIFSRVRGRIREGIRTAMSEENRKLWDEFDEDIANKEQEIERLRGELENTRDENLRLRARIMSLEAAVEHFSSNLSSEGRAQEGFSPPWIGSGGGVRPQVRSVADVVKYANENLKYVRVFPKVEKEAQSVDKGIAERFYDVLQELERCGPDRAEELGMHEENWMVHRGFPFASRESRTTMGLYGDKRRFMDDDGTSTEMQAHIKVLREYRIHLLWSTDENRWLIGYFGKHLPIYT